MGSSPRRFPGLVENIWEEGPAAVTKGANWENWETMSVKITGNSAEMNQFLSLSDIPAHNGLLINQIRMNLE